VAIDRSHIRVKAMLIAPNESRTAHAVSHLPATAENPAGYHRLIGGSVELGERHRDAIIREVDEELGATIDGLRYVATVENIFQINGTPGHEIVFLYAGHLNPPPARRDATLTEADGSVVPVVWRSPTDSDEDLPLYPAAANPWVQHVFDAPVRLAN
jgi:ADP-ribose pyrophosphatase YjhB (NUDIX family)